MDNYSTRIKELERIIAELEKTYTKCSDDLSKLKERLQTLKMEHLKERLKALEDYWWGEKKNDS